MISSNNARTLCVSAGILIIGALVFILLRPAPSPRVEAPHEIVQEPATADQNSSPTIAVREATQPAVAKNVMGDPLGTAYETAAFIDEVLNKLPPERVATRDHLKGIQVLFFVSDYVMAAKTNNSLALSESAIAAAFTNVVQDTSLLADRLRTWAVRPGTLTDHYRRISEIPGEAKSISAIKAALIENGVAFDPESDLLMDCIRYAVHNTSVHEMYGPNPSDISEATPFPAELNALEDAGDKVFRHRFAKKFGMDPRTITSLMNRIKDLRVYELSPADVEIPVTHFQ